MNNMKEYEKEFWSHFITNNEDPREQNQSFPCQLTPFQEDCIQTALFNASAWLDLPIEKEKEDSNTFHIKADIDYT